MWYDLECNKNEHIMHPVRNETNSGKKRHHTPGHLAGLGPDSSLRWLRAVFRRFAAAEAARSGRTPEHSDQLYSLLLQQLHASMCNSNEQAVYRLTTPPP